MQDSSDRSRVSVFGMLIGAVALLQIVGAQPSTAADGESRGLSASAHTSSVAAQTTGTLHWGGDSATSIENFDFTSLPGRLSDPTYRPLWREGMEFELRESLVASSRRYEAIAAEVPDQSYTYWRIARNYWRYGESLPVDAKEQRVHFFELAEEGAGRGIAVDPQCAPCMLWKFVAMGRQATTRGLLTAARDVREMDHLLTRGIELKPSHSDNEGNATLGNLYYSGAVFYRVIPDWFWLRWFIGVRGDRERSLEYARRAVEIAAVRVDYRVELGAALLCLGTTDDKPRAIEEGFEVLSEAQELVNFLSTDHLDKEHARVLVDSPEKACGYSRDGFIDVDAVLEESKASR